MKLRVGWELVHTLSKGLFRSNARYAVVEQAPHTNLWAAGYITWTW